MLRAERIMIKFMVIAATLIIFACGIMWLLSHSDEA